MRSTHNILKAFLKGDIIDMFFQFNFLNIITLINPMIQILIIINFFITVQEHQMVFYKKVLLLQCIGSLKFLILSINFFKNTILLKLH